MNHDIAHCTGKVGNLFCTKRDMCKRHVAHKELGAIKTEHICYLMPNAQGISLGGGYFRGCEEFVEY